MILALFSNLRIDRKMCPAIRQMQDRSTSSALVAWKGLPAVHGHAHCVVGRAPEADRGHHVQSSEPMEWWRPRWLSCQKDDLQLVPSKLADILDDGCWVSGLVTLPYLDDVADCAPWIGWKAMGLPGRLVVGDPNRHWSQLMVLLLVVGCDSIGVL